MSWVKLDDQLPDHPKMLELSSDAFRLWTYCLCRANARQSGGLLARKLVEVTAAYFASTGAAAALAAELVAAGLWHEVEGGWEIHDYDDYRPKTSVEDARKAKAAERMRKSRERARTVREQCANACEHVTDEACAHDSEQSAHGYSHENVTGAHGSEAVARGSNNARACAPPGPSHPIPAIKTTTPQPPKGERVGPEPLALENPAKEPEAQRNRGASKASANRLATELLLELNAARQRVNPKNRELAPVEANLVEIRARLLEGVTTDDIRHVIAVQEARSRVSADDAKWFNATTPFRKGNISRWLAVTVVESERPERQAGPPWGQPDPVAPPYFDRYVPKPRRESEPPPPGTLDVLKNLRSAT